MVSSGNPFLGTSRLFVEGAVNKEHCYVQDTNHRCGAGRGPPFATQCFRSRKRGHRQYINRHRGTGRPPGTWNTKPRLDSATRDSDEHSNNRKRQSQSFAKKIDTANKCDSQECAGVFEIIAPPPPAGLHHRSRASLRRPQCTSLREGLNTRST